MHQLNLTWTFHTCCIKIIGNGIPEYSRVHFVDEARWCRVVFYFHPASRTDKATRDRLQYRLSVCQVRFEPNLHPFLLTTRSYASMRSTCCLSRVYRSPTTILLDTPEASCQLRQGYISRLRSYESIVILGNICPVSLLREEKRRNAPPSFPVALTTWSGIHIFVQF